MFNKVFEAKVIEGVIAFLMTLFGVAAIYILYRGLTLQSPDPLLVVVELLLLILIALLGITLVGVKVWEQNLKSHAHHKTTHSKLAEHLGED